MPYNGSGTFTPAITFIPNTNATAEDQNTQDGDLAAGLTNCITRDGQSPATANIPFGGFKLLQVGYGSAPSDGVNIAQLLLIVPPGSMLDYAGSAAPIGFLLCDGSAISRATYSGLFGVIGTTFGNGDGTTTFNVPDFRGRVGAGLDNMGGTPANRLTSTTMSPDGNTLGASGGAQTVTLGSNNLPAYTPAGTVGTPTVDNITVVTGQATVAVQAGVGTTVVANVVLSSVPITAHAPSFTGSAQGGTDDPVNKVQPTLLINKIIKT